MRTTLTLDDDVARRLREVVRVRKTTFKQAVNETLRRGLEEVLSRPKARPFRTEPADMGTFAHLNYDNIGDLLEIAERTERRMILVDANLLLYAVNSAAAVNPKA